MLRGVYTEKSIVSDLILYSSLKFKNLFAQKCSEHTNIIRHIICTLLYIIGRSNQKQFQLTLKLLVFRDFHTHIKAKFDYTTIQLLY